MPYRIDVPFPPDAAFDRLVELGALDIDLDPGGITALMPDAVAPEAIATALAVSGLRVTPAVGRDADSVWRLRPRPLRIGRLQFVPADQPALDGGLRLFDSPAFGTGLHPTTALTLGALDAEVGDAPPAAVLDVGTGSGILALAALHLGARRVIALDVDAEAARAAAANLRLNGYTRPAHVVCGGPAAIRGAWPLVLANILAAPLMEMAPTLTQRVAGGGRLLLSGIPEAMAADVERVYRRLGMTRVGVTAQDGWSLVALRASW